MPLLSPEIEWGQEGDGNLVTSVQRRGILSVFENWKRAMKFAVKFPFKGRG
jgi:hypothetical protein